MPPEPPALDATGLAAAIRAGDISPVAAVEQALAAIAALDAEINAFTVTFPDAARSEAAVAARRALEPDPPPLLGVPISIKDHVWMRGTPATNGSVALRDFVPDEDATVVTRLRAAGAIIVGKTNNPEFLYRGTTDNALFGPTRNPWDLSRTPGGSSGGSAAAVAAGMGALSIGTDGGGSIRIPACFCNLVGHKPTFGLVPTQPGFRGWPTLSVTGPITRTARDAALMLSMIAGPDVTDDLSTPGLAAFPAFEAGGRGLRIAATEDMGFSPVDPEVRDTFRRAVATMRAAGWDVVDAHPETGDPSELWWRIAACESFASEGPLLERHEAEMTPGTAEIVRSGERFSAADYLDAQHERSAFTRRWAEFFAGFDLLVAPSLPVPAFGVGEDPPSEIEGRRCDPLFEDWCSMIYVANLTRQPSVSVPMGLSADGLPLGLQIIARRFEDALALGAAAAWEALQPWAGFGRRVSRSLNR